MCVCVYACFCACNCLRVYVCAYFHASPCLYCLVCVASLTCSLSHALSHRASSYFRKNHGRVDVMARLRIVFVGFNAALYLIELAFTLLQWAYEDEQGLRREQAVLWYQVYLAVILLLISVAFLYYGWRIYAQLRVFPPASHTGLRALKRVRPCLSLSLSVCSTVP
jgi:hypothetical protein